MEKIKKWIDGPVLKKSMAYIRRREIEGRFMKQPGVISIHTVYKLAVTLQISGSKPKE
jgi:hypothetical protein